MEEVVQMSNGIKKISYFLTLWLLLTTIIFLMFNIGNYVGNMLACL